MEDLLKQKISNNRKASTVEEYVRKVKRLLKEGLDVEFPASLNELLDVCYSRRNELVVWILRKYSFSGSLAPFFRAILVIFENIIEDVDKEKCLSLLELLRSFYYDAKKDENEIEVYKQPTEEEVRNRILPSDVVNKFDELKKQLKSSDTFDYLKWKRYLLLSFYRFLPPLRSQEIFMAKICNWKKTRIPETGNYIDVDNWRLVSRSHKTFKSYGEHIVDINDNELRNVIKQYLRKSGLTDGEYLIVKSLDDKQMVSSRWCSDTLKALIGCGVNHLRQTYIASFLDDLDKKKASKEINHSIYTKKRKELAKFMNHSVGTQETRYGKYRT